MYKEKLQIFLLAWLVLFARTAYADPKLIAIGTVSGLYQDFAEQTAGPLENGFPGNRLGGIGSGLAVPALNEIDHTHHFTGRSDNFDPLQASLERRIFSEEVVGCAYRAPQG
jgi:hypothetical protein